MKRMIEFEKGTGLLLQCAFRHVEAIQTIDMPMLIEHIALMLTHANAMEDPSVSTLAPPGTTFSPRSPS